MGRRAIYFALWTGLFVTSALAVLFLRPFGGGQPLADLQLRAREVDGRIQVNWNPAHPEVTRADSGVLRAQDGTTVREYPLPANVIQGGSLDYLRSSPEVVLTLTLIRGSDTGMLASVRSLAAPPPPPPPGLQRAVGEPPAKPPRRAQSRSRRRR